MNRLHPLNRMPGRKTLWPVTLALLALGTVPAAWAQGSADTPQARYRQERADCLAGRTTQSRATCLYEARSVLRDARREAWVAADPQVLADNALLRCNGLPQDAQSSCRRIIGGEGERSGSVAQGALLMWLNDEAVQPTVVSAAPSQAPQPARRPALRTQPGPQGSATQPTPSQPLVIQPGEMQPPASQPLEMQPAATQPTGTQPATVPPQPFANPTLADPADGPLQQHITPDLPPALPTQMPPTAAVPMQNLPDNDLPAKLLDTPGPATPIPAPLSSSNNLPAAPGASANALADALQTMGAPR